MFCLLLINIMFVRSSCSILSSLSHCCVAIIAPCCRYHCHEKRLSIGAFLAVAIARLEMWWYGRAKCSLDAFLVVFAMDNYDSNDGDYWRRAVVVVVILSMCYNGREGLLPWWRRWWGRTANLSRPWAMLLLLPRYLWLLWTMMIVTMVIIDGERRSLLLSWACVTMAMKGCRHNGGGVGGGLLISRGCEHCYHRGRNCEGIMPIAIIIVVREIMGRDILRRHCGKGG